MNNDLFIDSARVLAQNWELILAILLCVSWGTLLIFAILKKIAGIQFTDAELTALALGGWPLPALIISALLLALRLFIPADLVSVIAFGLLAISMGFAIRALWKQVSRDLVIPVFIFLFFVFIRLGFSANAVLPPYFNSAEHYRIIQSLINMDDVFTTSYYHIGYHVIARGIHMAHTCKSRASHAVVWAGHTGGNPFANVFFCSPRHQLKYSGMVWRDACRVRLVHASACGQLG